MTSLMFIQLTPHDPRYGRSIWVNVAQIISVADEDDHARVVTVNGTTTVTESVVDVMTLIHTQGNIDIGWHGS